MRIPACAAPSPLGTRTAAAVSPMAAATPITGRVDTTDGVSGTAAIVPTVVANSSSLTTLPDCVSVRGLSRGM